MTLDYRIDRNDDTVSIQLTGRIDRDAGTALDEAYRAATGDAPATVQLGFAGVDYINSTGIALIVGVLAKARAERIAMRASGLTAHYQHIFEITRLSDFIEVVDPTAR